MAYVNNNIGVLYPEFWTNPGYGASYFWMDNNPIANLWTAGSNNNTAPLAGMGGLDVSGTLWGCIWLNTLGVNPTLANASLLSDGINLTLNSPGPGTGTLYFTTGGVERAQLDQFSNFSLMGAFMGANQKTLLGNQSGFSGLWLSSTGNLGSTWSLTNYSILSEGANTYINAPAATGNVYIRSGNANGLFIDSAQKHHYLNAVDHTSTPGSSGTVNASLGKIALSSGSTSYVLTNSTIGANDVVFAHTITAGQPAVATSVVTAAGSVTITLAACATATCKVAFQVVGFAA